MEQLGPGGWAPLPPLETTVPAD